MSAPSATSASRTSTALTAWVEAAGYRIVWRGPKDTPPAFGLAFGFTTRSGERHAVVYRDGAMAWDPHPSRDGLTSVLTYLEFEASGEALTSSSPSS